MGDRSKIEWTDATWNPVRGCTKVSAGCDNCYAMGIAHRFSGAGQTYEGLTRILSGRPQWNGKVRLVPELLDQPLRWQKPRRIFVNSMSDLFHESVPFEFIAAVFAVMAVSTRHTFQVLTKRPQRMLEFFTWVDEEGMPPRCPSEFDDSRIIDAWGGEYLPLEKWKGYDNCGPAFPYRNVWLGVSVEDQATADERIPLLLLAPASVRWISAEPLIEKIDLSEHQPFCREPIPEEVQAELRARYPGGLPHAGNAWLDSLKLNWVVAGGESGPNARPAHPDWFRLLRDQCSSHGVPFLFKQWGSWFPYSVRPGGDLGGLMRSGRVEQVCLDRENDGHFRCGDVYMERIGKKAAGRELDGRTWDEYPEHSS